MSKIKWRWSIRRAPFYFYFIGNFNKFPIKQKTLREDAQVRVQGIMSARPTAHRARVSRTKLFFIIQFVFIYSQVLKIFIISSEIFQHFFL